MQSGELPAKKLPVTSAKVKVFVVNAYSLLQVILCTLCTVTCVAQTSCFHSTYSTLSFSRTARHFEEFSASIVLQVYQAAGESSLFRFDVESRGKVYCLAAETAEARQQWVEALNHATRRMGSPGIPGASGSATPVTDVPSASSLGMHF